MQGTIRMGVAFVLLLILMIIKEDFLTNDPNAFGGFVVMSVFMFISGLTSAIQQCKNENKY